MLRHMALSGNAKQCGSIARKLHPSDLQPIPNSHMLTATRPVGRTPIARFRAAPMPRHATQAARGARWTIAGYHHGDECQGAPTAFYGRASGMAEHRPKKKPGAMAGLLRINAGES